MKKTLLVVIALLVLFCCAPVLLAQTTAASTKEDKIRKILIQTDATGAFTREISAGIERQKQISPEVPAKFWDELTKEIDANKFVELVIPVYASFFNDQELTDLIAFYETPLGKKMIVSLPKIIAASEAVGGKYGEEAARKVIARMKAEGTWPAEPPPPKPIPAENPKP